MRSALPNAWVVEPIEAWQACGSSLRTLTNCLWQSYKASSDVTFHQMS